MDAPHDGVPADDADDDLTALLAPTGVRFRPGPPAPATPAPGPARPVAPVAPVVPVMPVRTAAPRAPAPPTAPPTSAAPAAPAAPAADQPSPRSGPATPPDRPGAPSTASSGVRTSTGTLGQRVGVGRWFQPVPGGVLPHADPAHGPAAVLRADPGTPVHAVTAGTVRRVLPGVAGGGVELHVAGGGTFVYTGTAPVVWTVQDDDDVDAGSILGVVATGGHSGSEVAGRIDGSDGSDGSSGGRADLLVLAVDEEGRALDAADLLVGLPDPGELALRPEGGGLGVDPYELDLELLGRTGGAS